MNVVGDSTGLSRPKSAVLEQAGRIRAKGAKRRAVSVGNGRAAASSSLFSGV